MTVTLSATASGALLSPVVIRLGAVGDMINVSALVHFLRLRYGRPCTVIGVGPWCVPVFDGNPDVVGIWALDRHRPFLLDAHGWHAVLTLRRSGPAPIYVCDTDRHLRRVQRLLRVSGVERSRCVFLADDPRRNDGHYLDALLRFGAATPAALANSNFPVPAASDVGPRLPQQLEAERSELKRWLTGCGGIGRPLILVQPGNRRTLSSRRARHRKLGRDAKAWPAERWVELLRRLHAREPSALLVLCGAPAEAPMLLELQAAVALAAVVQVAAWPLRRFFPVKP